MFDYPKENSKDLECIGYIPQCPEINFDKISTTIHKTYKGLTSMPQGFQKYIA